MDSSLISSLPAELRDHIYELVLRQPTQISINVVMGLPRKMYDPSHSTKLLSLTATCNQIRQESLPVFYRSNTFRAATNVLNMGHPNHSYQSPFRNALAISDRNWHIVASRREALLSWMHAKGAARGNLRAFEINLGTWDTGDFWHTSGYTFGGPIPSVVVAEMVQYFRNAFINLGLAVVISLRVQWALYISEFSAQESECYFDLRLGLRGTLDVRWKLRETMERLQELVGRSRSWDRPRLQSNLDDSKRQVYGLVNRLDLIEVGLMEQGSAG